MLMLPTLKGRNVQVMCCFSTFYSGDELLLTEMIFNGVFNDLSIQQCVALLSCFVFEEKVHGKGILHQIGFTQICETKWCFSLFTDVAVPWKLESEKSILFIFCVTNIPFERFSNIFDCNDNFQFQSFSAIGVEGPWNARELQS